MSYILKVKSVNDNCYYAKRFQIIDNLFGKDLIRVLEYTMDINQAKEVLHTNYWTADTIEIIVKSSIDFTETIFAPMSGYIS